MVVITPADEASAAEVKCLIAALRKTCLFQHASDADLFRLAMEMERVRFQPGEELGPREGGAQSHLFVVTAGRLERRSRGRLVYENVEDATREADALTSDAADGPSGSAGATGAAMERRNAVGRRPAGKPAAVVRATSAGPEGHARISIMCSDRPGLVAKAAAAIRAQGLSIDSSTINTTRMSRKDSALPPAPVAERRPFSPVASIRHMVFRDEGEKREELMHDRDQDGEHTAYQVHAVVDAKTSLPVTDAARMRRVEAALVRALEPDDWDGGVKESIVGSGGPATHLNGGYNAFGTLHVLGELPAFATTTAITSGVCWRLSSRALQRAMLQRGANGLDNNLPLDIASGLAAEVFRMSNSYSTPLFEQPAQKVNVAAVSVAAAVESYYRSALNGILNAAIQGAMANKGGAAAAAATASAAKKTGLDIARMFPEMHVQIPTRVVYINGFKLSRQWLADLLEEPVAAATARGDERARKACMLVPALLPGVLMTPVSSILEACSAAYANPEPLYRRCTRGLTARTVREVIFGLGLNNLTDWAEERIPRDVCESRALRNALGSVAAGVIAGYLSHVPHNLSTMKLLQPGTSYRAHVGSLVESARRRVPRALPPPAQDVAATALALIFPRGLSIRTTQVVGSFVLLNGISHLLSK